MLKPANLFLTLALLCCLGQAIVSPADEPKTGQRRDTLLYVRTVPSGAKVLLDGKELGKSDDAFPVDPGVGRIVVELDGYKSGSKDVTIRADGVTRVELALKQHGGEADDETPAPQGPVLTYEVDSKGTPATFTSADVDKLLKVVDRRVNADSKINARVRAVGDKQIEVALFDQDDESAKRVQRLLDRPGTLEFRLPANHHDHKAIIEQAEREPSKNEVLDPSGKKLAWWVPVQPSELPRLMSDKELVQRTRDEGHVAEVLVVNDRYDVTGDYLNRAMIDRDVKGQPCVEFALNKKGGDLFLQLTGDNLPDQAKAVTRKLGIILDGQIFSAPSVMSRIGDHGEISGGFTEQQASDLADTLNSRSLPARLRLVGTAVRANIDLSYVPNNAIAFYILRPAAVLSRPECAELTKQLDEKTRERLPPKELAQRTAIVLGLPENLPQSAREAVRQLDMVDIFQTMKANAFEKWMRQRPDAEKCAGKTYFVDRSGLFGGAVCCPNDRTLVYATSERAMQRFLEAKKGLPTFVDAKQWEQFHADQAVAALQTAPLQRLVELSKLPPESFLPPPALIPLWQDTSWAIGGLQIGDEVRIHAAVVAKDAGNVDSVAKAVEAARMLAVNAHKELQAHVDFLHKVATFGSMTPSQAIELWAHGVVKPFLNALQTQRDGTAIRLQGVLGMADVQKMLALPEAEQVKSDDTTKRFPITAAIIAKDGVSVDQNAWRIEAKQNRTVRLFEVPDPGMKECRVIYRAKLKTENLEGRAYLEMWCRLPGSSEVLSKAQRLPGAGERRLPGGVEYFSKGLQNSVTGTTDWASYEIPFFLEKGQHADFIKLNVVIEGTGTLWIKDVELSKAALEPQAKAEQLPATKKDVGPDDGSHDMQKYLNDTQEMVRQGKYQEALERFVWFDEHALEHEPSMVGVRLFVALSDWKALGDVYPPAKTAMVEMRDRKTRLLSAGGGNASLFQDVAALNQLFGESAKNVDLFQLLDQTRPDMAKLCWGMVKDAVISAKRFDLVRKYIGNPVREFSVVMEHYDRNKDQYDRPGCGAQFRASNENHLVEESLRLIEVALALDDRKAAQEIQEKALAIVDDHRLRDALPASNDKTAEPKNPPEKP